MLGAHPQGELGGRLEDVVLPEAALEIGHRALGQAQSGTRRPEFHSAQVDGKTRARWQHDEVGARRPERSRQVIAHLERQRAERGRYADAEAHRHQAEGQPGAPRRERGKQHPPEHC